MLSESSGKVPELKERKMLDTELDGIESIEFESNPEHNLIFKKGEDCAVAVHSDGRPLCLNSLGLSDVNPRLTETMAEDLKEVGVMTTWLCCHRVERAHIFGIGDSLLPPKWYTDLRNGSGGGT